MCVFYGNRGTHLIPPTSTSTSATAIFVATSKIVESAIFTEPPSSFVGATCENGKKNGWGTVPWGSETSSASSAGGAVAQEGLFVRLSSSVM